MPRARELEKIKADPQRLAAYKAKKAVYRKRYKAAHPEKTRADKRAYRDRNIEYMRALELLRWYSRKDIAAEAAKPANVVPQLDHFAQIAIYDRALALLPSSIPIENRRSYAAAALVAVSDGSLRPDFNLHDLERFRREDLPMGAAAKFVFVAEDARGILAAVY